MAAWLDAYLVTVQETSSQHGVGCREEKQGDRLPRQLSNVPMPVLPRVASLFYSELILTLFGVNLFYCKYKHLFKKILTSLLEYNCFTMVC